MSRQTEERNRQKFAEKMREKSLVAKNAKLTAKKAPEAAAPASGVAQNPEGKQEGSKKD
jgi:hypothetical protein